MNNKFLNIIVIGVITLKSILIILFSISIIAVFSELYSTRNQIEGRELIESTPLELFFLIAFLFMLLITLLFDIRTLKNKDIYNQWIRLLIFTILGITISFIFNIQWIGIAFIILISTYAFYLLNKFPKRITTANNVYKK